MAWHLMVHWFGLVWIGLIWFGFWRCSPLRRSYLVYMPNLSYLGSLFSVYHTIDIKLCRHYYKKILHMDRRTADGYTCGIFQIKNTPVYQRECWKFQFNLSFKTSTDVNIKSVADSPSTIMYDSSHWLSSSCNS